MTPEYVPGPDDEYRGVVEIDCTDGLPENVRAAIRPTRFIRETDSIGVIEFDCSEPSTASGPAPTPPPGPDAPPSRS